MASTPTTMLSPSELLDKRIADHRAEVQRLRAELGDPEEALSAWVRDTFDYSALLETFEEEMAGQASVLDDDGATDTDRDER